MPDWFVINPTRLPRTSAGECSTKTSTPGRTAGADAHAKAAATSRAGERFMISVTRYALRPRLQPDARSLGSPPRNQRAGPSRALDAGAGVLGQARGERGDVAGRALGGGRSVRAADGTGAERVADVRVPVCRRCHRPAGRPAGRDAGGRPGLVGGHVGAGMSGPAFDWAPDGAAIAFSHSPSPAGDDWVRADVSVVDVATGRTRSLVATPAAEGGPAWSPDGRWVAVTVSDAPVTYALTFRVELVSPANGAVRPLAESFDRRPAIVGWTGDARGGG